MGRGRAKAKQTKIARELKYTTGGTDLERLRAELSAQGSPQDVDDDGGPDAADQTPVVPLPRTGQTPEAEEPQS